VRWEGNDNIDQALAEYSFEVHSDAKVERIHNIVSIRARLLF